MMEEEIKYNLREIAKWLLFNRDINPIQENFSQINHLSNQLQFHQQDKLEASQGNLTQVETNLHKQPNLNQ
jgi:t-SNARE complex subunit (syntaxin)